MSRSDSNRGADSAKSANGNRWPWKRWGLIAGAWTVVGLFLGIRHYFYTIQEPHLSTSWRYLFLWLSCSAIWAVLTPPTLYLIRRFPLERGTWQRNLLVHVPASFFFLLLYVGISALAAWLILGMTAGDAFSPLRLRRILVSELFPNILAYWSIVAVAHGVDYYRQSKERELRASQLELRASQLEVSLVNAQLASLRLQLHPHFLFNTLNTISVLIKEDPGTANRMLLRLSDLLRMTLENAKTDEIPLRQEVALLRSYLDIEQARFHDRLSVSMDIDPNILDALVPMFLLQPLVENAIRHGIAPRPEAGTIQVSAQHNNGTVELRVCDDGPGLPEALLTNEAKGIGLSNTRARLDQLYRESHRFELSNATSGGLIVTVAIPYHTTANANTLPASGR